MEGRTSITIAHRLATVRRADVIFVLHDGVIAEQGRHEQLLARPGLYARLHRMQFQAAEASAGAHTGGVAPIELPARREMANTRRRNSAAAVKFPP